MKTLNVSKVQCPDGSLLTIEGGYASDVADILRQRFGTPPMPAALQQAVSPNPTPPVLDYEQPLPLPVLDFRKPEPAQAAPTLATLAEAPVLNGEEPPLPLIVWNFSKSQTI